VFSIQREISPVGVWENNFGRADHNVLGAAPRHKPLLSMSSVGSFPVFDREAGRRIDEMAAILRDPIAAESGFRLNKFEQSVGLKSLAPSPGESPHGVNHPAHLLKQFVEARAKSVRRQLDGKATGIILQPPGDPLNR
jgi:hypothetical protein